MIIYIYIYVETRYVYRLLEYIIISGSNNGIDS